MAQSTKVTEQNLTQLVKSYPRFILWVTVLLVPFGEDVLLWRPQ